jgi:hypothetical protein
VEKKKRKRVKWKIKKHNRWIGIENGKQVLLENLNHFLWKLVLHQCKLFYLFLNAVIIEVRRREGESRTRTFE